MADSSYWPGDSGLLTDLYQLTMLDAYLARDMHDEAVFEFFSRRLPESRNFLMSAGLEQLLEYLEQLSFTGEEVEWLESTGRFSNKLLDYLAGFKFTGTVNAMPEGTVFFANEPSVQVVAPLPQAQLIETRLINLLHYQTMIASKAARCVLVAPEKDLVDFGLRRTHGADAGLLAGRASYLAGFAGTATVLADKEFGIPVYGTMAHSFIQAHATEEEAFEHFARNYPSGSVLLIDTYDTLAAAEKVIDLAAKLRSEDIVIRGVRLDSGDLPNLARKVRHLLDNGGCETVTIFCSGNLDEYALARDFAGAPVDGYGIGTHLDVSADAPYLDCVYKLQEYAGEPRRKKSAGKETWPGRKQVFRQCDHNGRISQDILAEIHEGVDGRPLLEPVMTGGRRVRPSPGLDAVREHAAAELAALPESLRDPFTAGRYAVEISVELTALAKRIDSEEH
jgi:nicotinate phosphoribosyltransferase